MSSKRGVKLQAHSVPLIYTEPKSEKNLKAQNLLNQQKRMEAMKKALIMCAATSVLPGCYIEDYKNVQFLDAIQNPVTEVMAAQGDIAYIGGADTEINKAFVRKINESSQPAWTRLIDCNSAVDVVDAEGKTRRLEPVPFWTPCSIWGIAPDHSNNTVFAIEFRYQNMWPAGSSLLVHKLDMRTGESLWANPRLLESDGYGLGAWRPIRTSVIDGRLFVLENQDKYNLRSNIISTVSGDGSIWRSEITWTRESLPLDVDDGEQPLLSVTDSQDNQMRFYSLDGKKIGEIHGSAYQLGLGTTFKAGDEYFVTGTTPEQRVVARRLIRQNGMHDLSSSFIELAPEYTRHVKTADYQGGVCYAAITRTNLVTGYITKEGKLAWTKSTPTNGDDIKLQNVKAADGRCFTLVYNDTYTSKKPSIEVRLQENGNRQPFLSAIPKIRGNDIAIGSGGFWLGGTGGKHVYHYKSL